MEEKQKKNNIVDLGNKLGEKASEIGTKVSKTAKHAFDHINFFKHSTKRDKEFFKHDKEKDIKVIEAIENIKDDKLKAETLKGFCDSNNQKAIKIEKLHTVKYLAGAVIMGTVAVILNQSNQKQERDCQ
ncbi:TPA: hypothetical protein ACGN8S_005155 [Bacillus cereus]